MAARQVINLRSRAARLDTSLAWLENSLTTELIGNCRLRELQVFGDERGSLIALESLRDFPFELRRVYYIFGTKPRVERGFHAHRKLRQLAVCVAGSCTMVVDDGASRQEVLLDRPDLGLEIGPMVWREMRDFSENAVLLVLASDLHEDADYIRDYERFREMVRR